MPKSFSVLLIGIPKTKIIKYYLKHVLFFLSILFALKPVAQSNYGGLFPEIGLTKSYTTRFIKLKVESQHGLLRSMPEESDHVAYFHDRTDLQGFFGYTLKGSKVVIGYQYRLQPGINNHRSIQQISWSESGKLSKLSHRIRADQTFETGEAIQWRLRYRLSVVKNIMNTSYYLLLSDEPIYAYKGGVNSWENRLVFAYGIRLSGQSKLQFGPDYRIDADFGKQQVRTRLWLKVGWFKEF